MALSKETIDKQLTALGTIDTFGTKKEIQYLPEVLSDDEVIQGLCSGIMDNKTWLCVVTQKRIVMLDKGMIAGLQQMELPLSQIKSVSFKTGLLMSELLIDTGGQIKKMQNMLKADAPKIANIISNFLHNKTSEQAAKSTSVIAAEVDIVSQLERLAALKEKGILTDEEFASQKAKLLGNS